MTPLRVVTFIAALFAALSLGLGVAVAASNGHGNDDGVLGVFNGDQGTKACVHSRPLLERNERNVINYYRIAFNDKNPRLAVRLYGGAEYIQHNPLAANGFDAFALSGLHRNQALQFNGIGRKPGYEFAKPLIGKLQLKSLRSELSKLG